MSELTLAQTIEALLFLSSDPLSPQELGDATQAGKEEVAAALELLAEQYAPGMRGLRLRELAGGYTLATDPATEEAARRLFSRPRAFNLTPAQAETLAIVAYLQPISRPEITRIRGVSADSAATTLLGARTHRGGGALPVRRRPLPHRDALSQTFRSALAGGAPRCRAMGPHARGVRGTTRAAPARRGGAGRGWAWGGGGVVRARRAQRHCAPPAVRTPHRSRARG